MRKIKSFQRKFIYKKTLIVFLLFIFVLVLFNIIAFFYVYINKWIFMTVEWVILPLLLFLVIKKISIKNGC